MAKAKTDQVKAERGQEASPGKKARKTKDSSASNHVHLSDHVEAFLKSGGKVQRIPAGVSGQSSTSGPRQIVLSHKTTA